MSSVANAPSNTDAKPIDVERYPGTSCPPLLVPRRSLLLRDLLTSEMWEDRWVTGSTHWDKGASHEYLVQFLDSEESDKAGVVREGRAFVPGCGQVGCQWSGLS